MSMREMFKSCYKIVVQKSFLNFSHGYILQRKYNLFFTINLGIRSWMYTEERLYKKIWEKENFFFLIREKENLVYVI